MNSVFDDFLVSAPCDKCGNEFDETMARLKTSPDLTCPECGYRISVYGSNLRLQPPISLQRVHL